MDSVRRKMNLHVTLLLAIAFLTFVVTPIALVWAFIDGMRHKASDRPKWTRRMNQAVLTDVFSAIPASFGSQQCKNLSVPT